MTKKCSKCRRTLPLDEFARKSATKSSSWCKSCNRLYQKGHYAANTASYKAKARDWRAERQAAARAWLMAYLQGHPCVDCGEDDPVVLQFDHVRGAKTKDISQLLRARVTVPVLEAEAAKCDIRCANCHIRRTARQFGWYRLLVQQGAVDELGKSAALQAASSAGSSPVCAATA